MRRKAFTIYEMLLTLPLLVMIGIMMIRFGWQVIRTMTAARSEATATARLDNAVAVLRQDVWSAAEMHTISPHQLSLSTVDHHTITWEWGATQHLVRTAASGDLAIDEHRDWGVMPEFAMSVEDGALRVKVSDAPPVHGGSLCMPSPILLLGAKR
jgi:hypothetical protein